MYHQLSRELKTVELVGVVDENPARADAVAREFGCRAFGSIEQLVSTEIDVKAAPAPGSAPEPEFVEAEG